DDLVTGVQTCALPICCGVFKYDGDRRWTHVGLGDRRILTLSAYRGQLYALLNGGPVFRYDGGDLWTFCGHPEGSTQTYSAVIARSEERRGRKGLRCSV